MYDTKKRNLLLSKSKEKTAAEDSVTGGTSFMFVGGMAGNQSGLNNKSPPILMQAASDFNSCQVTSHSMLQKRANIRLKDIESSSPIRHSGATFIGA